METKIRLNNIQLYGWHGVGDDEKETGQQFEVDVEILLNLTSIIASDDIKKTVDYSELYRFVVSKFSEKKYNLIETLAHNITMSIKQEFPVKSCKVTIRKPDAPINGILDTVEVEVDNNG
jgi:dihydroneopterin aldolase